MLSRREGLIGIAAALMLAALVGDRFIITPVLERLPSENGIEEVGLIGISPRFDERPAKFHEAVANAGGNLYGYTKLVLVSVYRLITGKESMKNIGGPVIIAKLAGESARHGWGALVGFMALLSLNLGILNLLPLPVLDGGHMIFLGIEGIMRRPIPVKLKLIIQQVGMFLIFGLMLFVIYNDMLKILKK